MKHSLFDGSMRHTSFETPFQPRSVCDLRRKDDERGRYREGGIRHLRFKAILILLLTVYHDLNKARLLVAAAVTALDQLA